MAYDTTQPTDTTKIRNLGVVIRPNWVAIQEGDATFRPYAINLQNRTPLIVANDPATIAGSSIIYVKNDGAGNPESFAKDGAGNIVQLTVGGRLGGTTTNATISGIRFGASAVDYGVNNIISAAVRWNSAGATLSSFGCNIIRSAVGFYTVTLTTARANTNYWPIATAFDESNCRACKVNILSTTQFTVRITNDDGTSRDTGGFCMLAGGF
jgi:hypothetical protein